MPFQRPIVQKFYVITKCDVTRHNHTLTRTNTTFGSGRVRIRVGFGSGNVHLYCAGGWKKQCSANETNFKLTQLVSKDWRALFCSILSSMAKNCCSRRCCSFILILSGILLAVSIVICILVGVFNSLIREDIEKVGETWMAM